MEKDSKNHGTPELWSAVEQYFVDALELSDATLDSCLKASAEADLPPIQVAPTEGKLLHLLALANASRRILEIGTLGGYSTIWLARVLPADGYLISLEIDPDSAEVARQNLEGAGLGGRVEILVGRALELLPEIHREDRGPFDFIFIDADKENTPAYFEWALTLSRRGTIIVVDNVIRDGKIIDTDTDDPRVIGMRRFFDLLASEPRVSSTVIQTVGSKGYDGFALAVVIADV